MKELILQTKVVSCSLSELPENYRELVDTAKQAAGDAYAPYSGFSVGAACLLANGQIIIGSNQENAAYPSGLCAERVALFYAGARYPDMPVEVLAVTALSAGKPVDMISPCGACRQVMLETEQRYKYPLKLLLCGSETIYIIEEARALLPISFDGSDLPR